MGKQQAQKIATAYIQSHKSSFGNVSKKEIDSAIKRVAGVLRALPATK